MMITAQRAQGPNKQRAAHLELLKKMRNSGQRTPTTQDSEGRTYGYTPLSIPELDYYALTAKNPDLVSKDHETHKRAWDAFMKSDMSIPYRTSAYVGVRQGRGLI